MKKHIVILSAFLSPLRSGAEACAEEVPVALQDRYRFTIVTAKMRRDLPRRDTLRGAIPVVRVGLGLPVDKWLFPFLAPWAARREKPDIIHAVLETFAGLALCFAAFTCPRARRILTCQTTNRGFLKGPIVRLPDTVTAISSALRRIVQRFRRDDVALIPNGVDLASFRAARDRIQKVQGRVLFVGRLEPVKGVDTLLRAFAVLAPGALLRVVGEGSQRCALEKLATDLGITDRVDFAGRIPPERIADEYAQAEIFCGLSRSEALGNVFLEAQAGECAVIGTNVGGIPDIVENEVTGLLVAPDDPAHAAAALKKLLSDENLRSRLSQAGADRAAAFGWDAIAERYGEIYDSQRHLPFRRRASLFRTRGTRSVRKRETRLLFGESVQCSLIRRVPCAARRLSEPP